MSINNFLEAVNEESVLGSILAMRSLESLNSQYSELGLETPLTYAVCGGCPEIIEALLDLGADPNATNVSRQRALHIAKTPEVVQMLLAHGADVDAQDEDGDTAMHYASWDHDFSILVLLLKAGGDMNLRGMHDRTPLHVTCTDKFPEGAILLIESGADITLLNTTGQHALDMAEQNGLEDVVTLLNKVKEKD